jgi:hypothetical protein
MASKRTPYELAEEILGLAQTLVLELGGSDGGPPGGAGEERPAQLDLRTAVEDASAGLSEEAQGEETTSSRKLVGASWAPRSWS